MRIKSQLYGRLTDEQFKQSLRWLEGTGLIEEDKIMKTTHILATGEAQQEEESTGLWKLTERGQETTGL